MNKFLKLSALLLASASSASLAGGSGHTLDYQKPGAPVSAAPDVWQMQSGATLQVPVQLQLSSPVDAVQIRLAASEGLQLLQADTLTQGATAPGVLAPTATVYAAQEGTYAIHAFIETRTGDAIRTRAVSVPVQVGAGQAKLLTNGVLKPSASRNVVSLQAAETIKAN